MLGWVGSGCSSPRRGARGSKHHALTRWEPQKRKKKKKRSKYTDSPGVHASCRACTNSMSAQRDGRVFSRNARVVQIPRIVLTCFNHLRRQQPAGFGSCDESGGTGIRQFYSSVLFVSWIRQLFPLEGPGSCDESCIRHLYIRQFFPLEVPKDLRMYHKLSRASFPFGCPKRLGHGTRSMHEAQQRSDVYNIFANKLSQAPQMYFIKNVLGTSAVSSTNFGSILIFISCVVGTCNILLYG